ncbi:hypothetical protein SASPL_150366 [Salvia splendens]|uniref:Uncharacterized protein n=1 Tax=Salvia splendens TaxID=180675 RepID=A0A8X8W6G5_SALSN|nr:hypothetical protein SASPL_150366 [Salvia splendens]
MWNGDSRSADRTGHRLERITAATKARAVDMLVEHRRCDRGTQRAPRACFGNCVLSVLACGLPIRPGSSEHTCWDPKDGELCLSEAKPEETLVEARSDTDMIAGARVRVLSDEQLRKQAKNVYINQERKLGDRRRSDIVLVSTINDADQGSADVAFRTPLAPYEKSKYLGSGGSRVARLKLKGIERRAPPEVEPAA